METNNEEIKYLVKTIDKLMQKAKLSYLFMGLGVIVILLGVFYIAQNGLSYGGAGPFYIMGIGVAIIIFNILMCKSYLKRANELSKDLEKSQNIHD